MVGVTGQPVLRVTARQPQRYRAGFRFGPEPRVLTADDFGEMDIEVAKKVVAICSDPVLTVEWPDDPEADAWIPIDDFRLSQIRSIAFPDEQDDGGMAEAMTAWDAPDDADTLGAAGASASSDADVTTLATNGGGADNQPSAVAPSAPVAGDQDVAATVPDQPASEIPKPAAAPETGEAAAPSGRKKTAKPAKAD